MTFSQLQEAALAFTSMVNEDLGQTAIQPMTLEAPEPPPDELHFHKLVVWCFGFFYEAAADILKECRAMLKTRAPEQTNRYDQSSRVIQNLRTYKVHNLPPINGNQKKQATAKDWIADASDNNRGFSGATDDLCKLALDMLSIVSHAWKESTQDAADRAQLVDIILLSLQRTWQPHQFDEIVRQVTDEIGLKGFDAVAFRSTNINKWRDNARYFIDRETADIGLRRIIRRDMENTFGSSD